MTQKEASLGPHEGVLRSEVAPLKLSFFSSAPEEHGWRDVGEYDRVDGDSEKASLGPPRLRDSPPIQRP